MSHYARCRPVGWLLRSVGVLDADTLEEQFFPTECVVRGAAPVPAVVCAYMLYHSVRGDATLWSRILRHRGAPRIMIEDLLSATRVARHSAETARCWCDPLSAQGAQRRAARE